MSDTERSPVASIVTVVDRLLGEGGCPWDREQTLESMRPYVVEEAFEVVEAIDRGEAPAIREELGDLLFLVVFLARLTDARFGVGLADVSDAIADKMTRRHPWVFGDAVAADSDRAIEAWEAQKALERTEKGRLSGVPTALPALLRAYRVGEKASSVGYDFRDAEAARGKVDEELGELDEALVSGDPRAVEHELGDVLFAVANHARKLGIDPESALRTSLDRFTDRFRACELAAREQGTDLASLDDAARDRLWELAKSRR